MQGVCLPHVFLKVEKRADGWLVEKKMREIGGGLGLELGRIGVAGRKKLDKKHLVSSLDAEWELQRKSISDHSFQVSTRTVDCGNKNNGF